MQLDFLLSSCGSTLKLPNQLKLEDAHAESLLNLPFHPNSSVQVIGSRLPDVDFTRLQDLVRKMARANEIQSIGGRKYRKYSL